MKHVNHSYVIVNLLYLALVLLVVVPSFGFDGQAGLVPMVLGIPTLVLILFSLGRELLSPQAAPDDSAEVAPWAKAAPIVAWLGVFCVLVFFIGFLLTIPVYIVLFLRSFGRLSWQRCTVAAVAVWALVYVSLKFLLHRILFEGVLFGAIPPLL